MPPPRFSTGELLEKDVNFCYGSYYNSLWLFIDKIHNLGLRYDNSQQAIDERKFVKKCSYNSSQSLITPVCFI